MLQGADESAENILFCTDEDVLCAIEEHDMDDINVNPSSREVPLFLIFLVVPCCVVLCAINEDDRKDTDVKASGAWRQSGR